MYPQTGGKDLCVLTYVCRSGGKSFLGVANYTIDENNTMLISQV